MYTGSQTIPILREPGKRSRPDRHILAPDNLQHRLRNRCSRPTRSRSPSRSFAVEVAAFQGERCLGYSRAITVVVGKDHSPAALSDEARAILSRALLPSTHLPAATKPGEERQQLNRYEHRVEFVTRFSDTDAIGHLNNIAVLRYCEEGRAALLVNAAENSDPRALGTVLSFDISYLREARPFAPIIVATSLEPVDGSQVRLIQALFQEDACVATCDWALEIPQEVARKLG